MAVTTGTNTPATLSANFWMGGLDAPASRTILTIFESVVSAPILCARIFITPLLLSAAEVIWSPIVTSTGRLSPVIADLSIKVLPSVITPSTGIYSPCLTTRISPAATCETGTSISFPSTSFVTLSGARRRSFSISLPVRRFDFSSSHLPTVTRVKMVAADSKYRFIAYPCATSSPACTKMRIIITNEYKNETPAPSATSVSILGTFLISALTPLVKKRKFTPITAAVSMH